MSMLDSSRTTPSPRACLTAVPAANSKAVQVVQVGGDCLARVSPHAVESIHPGRRTGNGVAEPSFDFGNGGGEVEVRVEVSLCRSSDCSDVAGFQRFSE